MNSSKREGGEKARVGLLQFGQFSHAVRSCTEAGSGLGINPSVEREMVEKWPKSVMHGKINARHRPMQASVFIFPLGRHPDSPGANQIAPACDHLDAHQFVIADPMSRAN